MCAIVQTSTDIFMHLKMLYAVSARNNVAEWYPDVLIHNKRMTSCTLAWHLYF